MSPPNCPKLPDGSTPENGGKYRRGFFEADWQPLGVGLSDAEKHRVYLRHKRENSFFRGGTIYHYTSIPGLHGIIETNGFWASDNRFMNDTEELSHGIDLVKDILQRLEVRENIHNFKSILAEVRNLLPGPHSNTSLVTCFSLSRDSLEQWRGYGPSGGICIALTSDRADDEFPLIVGPDLLLHKVKYGIREKAICVISTVRRFRREYKLDRAVMPDWPDDHDRNYAAWLANSLAFSSLLFKNEAFRAEQEVRYVVAPSHASRFAKGLEFRPSAVGMIPFVNTGWQTDPPLKLPIREVIVGPSPHQDVIARSMEAYLTARGYPNVRISCSAVPFRAF